MSEVGHIQNFVRVTLSSITGEQLADASATAPIPTYAGDTYDSLAVTELVTALEEEFDFEVDYVNDDLRYWFDSIERISEFVSSKQRDLAAVRGE